jgi:hypothetical protein
MGYTVLHLHQIGKGCPDILVGNMNGNGERQNLLVEIKDGSKSPSRQKLTPDERTFMLTWKGPTIVATAPEQVVEWFNNTREG